MEVPPLGGLVPKSHAHLLAGWCMGLFLCYEKAASGGFPGESLCHIGKGLF